MIPDKSQHYVIGFSGGKDSVATWLHLTRELQLPHVTCTFADTGHESPITYDYIDMLAREHDLPLVKIQPIVRDVEGELRPEKIAERLPDADPLDYFVRHHVDGNVIFRSMPVRELEHLWAMPLDMERLAILKRRFPSTMARFCTTHLKLYPQRRWLREHCDLSHVVRVSGVRAEESPARAKHPVYQFDEFMGCPLWLPIHHWSHGEVFACHKRHGVPPNPLYLQGMSRVGCFPCIMSRREELVQIALRFPDAMHDLKAMENRVAESTGHDALSFFSNNKTPERFHSHVCPQTGKSFPDALDVMRWALNEPTNGQQLMFEDDHSEDGHTCSSQYGLCE